MHIQLPPTWNSTTVAVAAATASLDRTVSLEEYPNAELPLQNLEDDGRTNMAKNDMADLPHLHEAAILYNLKERIANAVPYTRVGDIMVAMNPFQVST